MADPNLLNIRLYLCANCATCEGELQKCSRCRSVSYCGRECQRSHWREHKKFCVAAVISLSSLSSLNALYSTLVFIQFHTHRANLVARTLQDKHVLGIRPYNPKFIRELIDLDEFLILFIGLN